MFEPSQAQVDAALAHAEESQPDECCGVIADGEYHRLVNQAAGVHDQFAMDMRGFLKISESHRVEAIVHSHVYLAPIASDADRSSCENINLPWLIVAWPTRLWTVIEPTGFRAPLVGRTWAWGAHDCFSLIRDGFEAYTGIRIPDFQRDWLFWERGENLIVDHYADAGFVPLPQDTPPQHCDIFGMRIQSKVINHLGLFLASSLTGGDILHQLMGRLSVREVYGGTYRQATELHLRHKNFLTGAPPR